MSISTLATNFKKENREEVKQIESQKEENSKDAVSIFFFSSFVYDPSSRRRRSFGMDRRKSRWWCQPE